MPELGTQPVIKGLCQQIAAEENPRKLKQLVHSLRNTVEVERDETRLRLRLIAQQYRGRISSSPHASRILEVVSFLGLARRGVDS